MRDISIMTILRMFQSNRAQPCLLLKLGEDGEDVGVRGEDGVGLKEGGRG